jgi:hypothetical protein
MGPANKIAMGDELPKQPVVTPANVDDDPKQVPEKFTALHPDLIQLLARSRSHLGVFTADPRRPFWKAMEAMSIADLHTLVQVQKGTMGAGLWSSIKALDQIYTYGTSWGIHFIGSPGAIVMNGAWGRDHPQLVVASQHPGGENFTWYRQNTGAGNPGLHLGVGNGGEHHDVHWDPTNPMERVGTGQLEWTSGPMGMPFPYRNPKGDAVYAVGETLAHMAEVGGVSGPSKNADMTKAYLDGYFLDETRKHATNYINMENNPATKARTSNLGRSENCVAKVQAQIDRINDITAQMRGLAMQDDKQAKAELNKVSMRILPTRAGIISTMVTLFQHMKAEAPGVAANGYDSQAGWANNTFGAYDTCSKLTAGRQKF